MKEVFKNDYISIFHNKDANIIASKWNAKTINMTESDFKKSHMAIVNAILNSRSNAVIGDARKFSFSIVPNVQEWILHETFPVIIRAGLRKIAMIVSPDVFSQVSLEQSQSEQEASPLTIKYFEEKEEAISWVTS